MNVLLATLKEELKSVERLEKKYLKRIAALPRGSFIVRTRGQKRYGYLTSREGGRVVQKYLGKMDDGKIERYRKLMGQKRDYKKKLKSVREQKSLLRRVLRGKTA